MKKLVLLFAALLVAGCGEKSSSDSSESASESAEPSDDTAEQNPAGTPVAESPSEEASETPNSLSDADVERLLKEAVDHESLEERGDFLYQNDEPYSGWVKSVADSGQVMGLGQCKDGKPDGLSMAWGENGQKIAETTFKDGKMDGLLTFWHENGQKMHEGIAKDGVEVSVSAKYWNSKGEEVETKEESWK